MGKVSLRQFQRYVNGFYPKLDVEVTAFQSFWYQFSDKHKVCIFCMCLVADGFAGKTVTKGYHRKCLVETIPTYM